jgi:hypothetical protein
MVRIGHREKFAVVRGHSGSVCQGFKHANAFIDAPLCQGKMTFDFREVKRR